MMDTPSEVRDALHDQHGVDADLSQLSHYDPTTKKGERLASDLKELFFSIRERFVDHQFGISIAEKSKRLRELEKQMHRLINRMDQLDEADALIDAADMESKVREVLKQAAEEMGGKYTNRTEVSGPDGGPIEQEHGGVMVYLPDNGRGGGPEPSDVDPPAPEEDEAGAS